MKVNDVTQADNSTLEQKVTLRYTALKQITNPVVLETHGGWGEIFAAAYGHIRQGVVLEKDPQKAEYLARQRPTWAVYEGDSAAALSLGAGAHLVTNVLDIDPYGDPWPVIQAYFRSARQMADSMVVVVNDGLRQMVRTGTSWQSNSLSPIVAEWGNDLFGRYLEVCEELMRRSVLPADYHMTFFDGYHTGHSGSMTHYLAVLEKQKTTG